MKKLIQWAAGCTAAALLFSPLAFAQPLPPAGTTTITVEKITPPPSGYKICYVPSQRHVQGSRVVQRCGPYGCNNFRVTRDFYVTVYEDCHLEKYSCSRGYKSYGWYPSKHEARNALDRCQHTINGNVPTEWHIQY